MTNIFMFLPFKNDVQGRFVGFFHLIGQVRGLSSAGQKTDFFDKKG